MLSALATRPFIISSILALILVYSWLGHIIPIVNEPASPEKPSWFDFCATSPRQVLDPIPKKIWQINFSHPRYELLKKSIRSWEKKNRKHKHKLLDAKAGRKIIWKHYRNNPEIINTYFDLRSPILRADYLRYLVLAAEGGVYSDLDTEAIKPIQDWDSNFPNKTAVRAIIGIEYDQLKSTIIPEGLYMPIQFCQWTLAFSAHHPLMISMVKSVTRGLLQLSQSHGVPLSQLQPRVEDVLFTTGPVKWTQEVFAYLSSVAGEEMIYQNFTGLRKPQMVGDVVVLPIRSFATGLGYAGSGFAVSDDTLLRHTFQGSWKEDKKNG
ncbi:MAG: hypothetical protein Q9222_006467 [Ikaeria aurantiellina]